VVERRVTPALLAVAAVLLWLAGSLAEPAAAASGEAGKVRIDLVRKARYELRRAKVGLSATHPSKASTRRLRLLVRGGTSGAAAQLTVAGRVRFARRGRVAKVRHLHAVVTSGSGYVTGRVRGTQITLFKLRRLGRGVPFDPLTGQVDAAARRIVMPRLARETIARQLGLRHVGKLPSVLGPGRIRAVIEPVPAKEDEPPARRRPAGAVDVVSAELTWRARESWIDYLHDAPDGKGGATAFDGAVNGAPETIPPSTEPRVYEFTYPFAEGWYDPGSGAAEIKGSGTVRFFKTIAPFGIDLDVSAPELELGGRSPRLIGLLNGRRNNADQRDRRAVLVDLDQDAVTPATSDGPEGTTIAYEEIPGLVPDGTDIWPVAGYYAPGDDWGWVSVEFTVGGGS
jgi:hypothetical protein